jgi:hypothetical protein
MTAVLVLAGAVAIGVGLVLAMRGRDDSLYGYDETDRLRLLGDALERGQ